MQKQWWIVCLSVFPFLVACGKSSYDMDEAIKNMRAAEIRMNDVGLEFKSKVQQIGGPSSQTNSIRIELVGGFARSAERTLDPEVQKQSLKDFSAAAQAVIDCGTSGWFTQLQKDITEMKKSLTDEHQNRITVAVPRGHVLGVREKNPPVRPPTMRTPTPVGPTGPTPPGTTTPR